MVSAWRRCALSSMGDRLMSLDTAWEETLRPEVAWVKALGRLDASLFAQRKPEQEGPLTGAEIVIREDPEIAIGNRNALHVVDATEVLERR